MVRMQCRAACGLTGIVQIKNFPFFLFPAIRELEVGAVFV